MKKTILFAVILALLVPSVALAAAEFSLGGFIKLDAFWDSTQTGKNMNTPIARNIDPSFHNGRMKFTAQGSRFSFTIKGPKLFGAQTTGFMEVDFDSSENPLVGTAFTASNSFTPRLRHAMFRFNWPETELLFGQYWSMFCEFYSENVQDGPMQGHGTPTARMAQVRLTQKFLGSVEVAGLIGQPNNVPNPLAAAYGWPVNQGGTGEAAETPQVQGSIKYSQDLWGKAAYYGKPMPFTARVIGGWQRNNFRSAIQTFGQQTVAMNTFGQNGWGAMNVSVANHQYVDPWMVMANVFIPVIPTTSANLAGTASLSAQAYIGQGVGAFGENMGNDAFFNFSGRSGFPGANSYIYDYQLYKKFGGYVQGQYYFTNQWFANVTAGLGRLFGVPTGQSANAITAANPGGYTWAGADQAKSWWEIDATLWYRPIQAIKFGLQYSYSRTDWLQKLNAFNSASNAIGVNSNFSDVGDGHRVEFVGFFYF